MPSENLIKDPITSEGDRTTKSQNHGALHVEGKLGNYILISGFIFRMGEFSLGHKQQLDTKREMWIISGTYHHTQFYFNFISTEKERKNIYWLLACVKYYARRFALLVL